MADSVTFGKLGSQQKDFTIQSTEAPDFETLWPLLIHIIGSILVGTSAIATSAS